jgi:hypothetical protein
VSKNSPIEIKIFKIKIITAQAIFSLLKHLIEYLNKAILTMIMIIIMMNFNKTSFTITFSVVTQAFTKKDRIKKLTSIGNSKHCLKIISILVPSLFINNFIKKANIASTIGNGNSISIFAKILIN